MTREDQAFLDDAITDARDMPFAVAAFKAGDEAWKYAFMKGLALAKSFAPVLKGRDGVEMGRELVKVAKDAAHAHLDTLCDLGMFDLAKYRARAPRLFSHHNALLNAGFEYLGTKTVDGEMTHQYGRDPHCVTVDESGEFLHHDGERIAHTGANRSDMAAMLRAIDMQHSEDNARADDGSAGDED